MNRSVLRLWLAGLLLLLGGAAPVQGTENFSSVFISEILADNQRGLQDDDGNYSGWIELYNGSSRTLNLSGWFLTDSPTNLTKWRFPRVGLLPEKYLLVFASGKASTNDLAHLHANFSLNKQGGYLAVVNATTNIVSEFAPYPKQSPDVSYGRVRGEPAIGGSFPKPTPGKPNTATGKHCAPEIVFSHPGGTFTVPFKLQLSTRSPGASIRYTVDGTFPNSNSPAYSAPLSITNTIHLRARAYQSGLLPGPPQGECYLRLHTNAWDFTSTLPVLVLDSAGRNQSTSPRSSFVHVSVYEPVSGKTSLTNRATLATRGGFHVRGSSTGGLPQASFALEFLDEFNQERDHALLGMPADSDWVLYAPNEFDPIMIHNPFVHQLSRDMGRYSPRTRFVEVFLNTGSGPVNAAHYHGIYVLEEKIKIGKQRVAIDRLGPEDLKPPEITGGYLVKIDRTGPGEMGFWAGGATMVYVEPKEPLLLLPQRAAQRHYLNRYLNDFDNALNSAKWKEPLAGYRAYIDVEAWIDFHVLEVLSGNVDIFGFSTFFYKPRNGKLIFGPHWDFDRALGSTDHRDQNPRVWNTGPFFGHGPWWPRVLSDPDFWQLWVDRWQDLRRNHFALTNLYRLVDSMTGELREAQPREAKRWGLYPRGGSYDSEVRHMKNWLSNRIDFIDQQLAQPPQPSHPGGKITSGLTLTITAPPASTNTAIYYTLDGSDPRLTQGAIASNAMIYTSPIPIKSNTWLVARVRNPAKRQIGGPPVSTPWSAPVKAKFAVSPR